MDRLGDLSVAERFPIAFWNAGDRRLHRRVLIRANRENLAGHFAPVEDRRLIGRAVRANGHDPFALWHVAFAGLQKLEVPCRRRGVAFAKLMADHDAKFRDMPDHRHVALLALVGVMGLVLFRDDLRCVDIERVVDAFVAQQQTPKDAAVYVLQPDQATALFRADATQPITGRVAARHFIQLRKKSAQPFVTAQYTQILQCPSAASEHQDQRQDMKRRAVARRAAGRRQFTVDQAANPETVQIFAEQRQPALRGQRFLRPRQLERQHRLRRPHRTLQVNNLRQSMTLSSSTSRSFWSRAVLHRGCWVSYIQDTFGNPTGGIKQGATYGSVLYMAVDADLAKLAGLPGTTFRVNAYQIQGRNLSAENIFNYSTISGLAARPTTRLFELWIEQKLFDDMASIRIGQLTADNQFFISEFGNSLFINVTFGWSNLFIQDLPGGGGPNYPLATPGVRLKVTPTDQITLLAAIFNGDPAGTGFTGLQEIKDPAGINFRLRDPPFLISEAQYQV